MTDTVINFGSGTDIPLSKLRVSSEPNLFIGVQGPPGKQNRVWLPAGHFAPHYVDGATYEASNSRAYFADWDRHILTSFQMYDFPPDLKKSITIAFPWQTGYHGVSVTIYSVSLDGSAWPTSHIAWDVRLSFAKNIQYPNNIPANYGYGELAPEDTDQFWDLNVSRIQKTSITTRQNYIGYISTSDESEPLIPNIGWEVMLRNPPLAFMKISRDVDSEDDSSGFSSKFLGVMLNFYRYNETFVPQTEISARTEWNSEIGSEPGSAE